MMAQTVAFLVVAHQTMGLRDDGAGGVIIPTDGVYSTSAWVSGFNSGGAWAISIVAHDPLSGFSTVVAQSADDADSEFKTASAAAFEATAGQIIKVTTNDSTTINSGEGAFEVAYVSRLDPPKVSQP